jgi:guanine deaminase
LSANARVIRGRILTFNDDPATSGASAHSLIEDGAVLVGGGRIEAVGEAPDVLAHAPEGAVVDDHAGSFIMSGFIDAHIHYPQTQVIGSYGAQLLDWLQNYTFIEEQKFADPAHCARGAEFFLDELFRSGTTTAMVYCTVHPQSVDAFFTAAEARGARMIAGKVMMDRDAPQALMDTAQRGYDESKALIALAQSRETRLRDHAALRGDVDASATGRRRRLGARVSGLLCPDPRRRKQGRDRPRRGVVPGSEKLHRRLRAGGPDRSALGVRPLHPSAGERGR